MSHKEKIDKAEATGIRVVEQIVREWWGCGFQEFDARNDDGIDGLIIVKNKGRFTGEIIHAQIKCGKGYRRNSKSRPNKIGVNLGKEYINAHRPKWNSIIEPAILIYVDDSTDSIMPHAWWCDLKADNSFGNRNNSQIFIPNSQRFGAHSVGDLKKMYGTRHLDHALPKIIMNRSDVNLFSFTNSLKKDAREFYLDWANLDAVEREHPKLGEVIVSRVGWRHLTRNGRKTERTLQSFQLLGVAKRMIKEIENFENFGHAKNEYLGNRMISKRYLGIRGFVVFPHRYESAVTVVLRNQVVTNIQNGTEIDNKTWFYSVYESRKGRKK